MHAEFNVGTANSSRTKQLKLLQLSSVGGVDSNLKVILRNNELPESFNFGIVAVCFIFAAGNVGAIQSSIVARRTNLKKLLSHLHFVIGESHSNNLAVVHAIVIPSVTVLNAREDRRGVDVLPIILVNN